MPAVSSHDGTLRTSAILRAAACWIALASFSLAAAAAIGQASHVDGATVNITGGGGGRGAVGGGGGDPRGGGSHAGSDGVTGSGKASGAASRAGGDGASTTGVVTGCTLTPSGPVVVSSDNEVVQGLDIDAVGSAAPGITLSGHTNVTIRNCRIRYGPVSEPQLHARTNTHTHTHTHTHVHTHRPHTHTHTHTHIHTHTHLQFLCTASFAWRDNIH
jgi:hypothetical protein